MLSPWSLSFLSKYRKFGWVNLRIPYLNEWRPADNLQCKPAWSRCLDSICICSWLCDTSQSLYLNHLLFKLKLEARYKHGYVTSPLFIEPLVHQLGCLTQEIPVTECSRPKVFSKDPIFHRHLLCSQTLVLTHQLTRMKNKVLWCEKMVSNHVAFKMSNYNIL